MKILTTSDKNYQQELAKIRSPFKPLDFELMKVVQAVIEDVAQNGDLAVCELTQKFDHVALSPDQLRVPEDEIDRAYNQTDPKTRQAIQLSIDNVRRYQDHIKVYQQNPLKSDGSELRTRYAPIARVGICVPGGSAPLASTVIMTAVPAQVAGVKEIVLVSPPKYQNSIHPTVLACCKMLGITEAYRVGGMQAVAALALGTQTIRQVDKIVGPGHPVVQMAKKMLYCVVGIDSFAGASEIVVLADDSADPRFVASDLIGQAEHDPGSGILVTTSRTLAAAVEKELDNLLESLSRKEQTRRCLDQYGAIIIADNLDDAINAVNDLAPEHLSVQTKNYDTDAERCITAGAIFVGPYTSEALGDYVAGPSHVLPTSGTARFFSPLNVMDFMRHTSVIKYNKNALKKIYPAIEALTDTEMLPGHKLSAKVRLE
ncbi:MAG: histidinol dehydrogenase [Phycisphaerae bacterium]|nr:histidinol dehydrogenase [Phycisphaerae bacterium]